MTVPVKAAIVCLNTQYIHSAPTPWYLLAGVRAYGGDGVTATVVEGTVNETDDALWERITATGAAVVGFCCYIWNITTVLRLCERLHRECPAVHTVLGGPEVSYRAGQVLTDYPGVEFVIGGEGERPFAALLTALAGNRPLSAVDGLSYREPDGTLRVAEPYLTDEVPPSPYTPEYLATLGGRIAYLETSRGCPFSCAFCLSGRCGGVRWFPTERSRAELLALADAGVKVIKFVDRTFNADRRRMRDWLSFIAARYGKEIPAGVSIHFEVAGDLLDEATVLQLAELPAGAVQLEIGLQSFHEPTLAAVCRKTDSAHLTEVLRRLISAGNVHIHVDLIAGLPQEDLPTFIAGFDRAFSLHPHQLQLGFLKLLYGAPMREEPERYPCTYAPEPPYEVTATPWMSAADLDRLRAVEDVLERLYNSGRFRHTLRYLTETLGRSPFAVLETVAADLPAAAQPLSLDDYTVAVWTVLSATEGVDPEALRDAMITDRVATNPGGALPAVLDVRSADRRRLKRLADTDARFARPAGVKRGTGCLSDGTLIWADQTAPHPITGAYPLHYFTAKTRNHTHRAVLFDLDGTLTDPSVGITSSVQYALRQCGIEVADRRTLTDFIGPPLRTAFEQRYGFTAEQSAEALRQYRVYYSDTGLYQTEVYDGIVPLLRDLRRAGFAVVMATSKPEPYARRLAQQFGFTAWLDDIVGSDMAETRADKASVIREALCRLHLTPAEAVMVGDRRFDIEGAHAVGCLAVGVLYGFGSREELTAAGADQTAATVEELRSLLLAEHNNTEPV